MKKLVPDPPSLDLSNATTADTPFGTNRMFAVRAGIPAEEALLHACHLLQCAICCNVPRLRSAMRSIISRLTTAPWCTARVSTSRRRVR